MAVDFKSLSFIASGSVSGLSGPVNVGSLAGVPTGALIMLYVTTRPSGGTARFGGVTITLTNLNLISASSFNMNFATNSDPINYPWVLTNFGSFTGTLSCQWWVFAQTLQSTGGVSAT